MAYTLFIADLHLNEGTPERTELLRAFLHQHAYEADALYILGDLFEMWVGEDYLPDEYQVITATLDRLTQSGVKLYYLLGNRDFLVGETFAAMSGCELLPEPARISLYGIPYLLMHGDTLCTDDKEYQEFRARVRTDEWRKDFFSQTLDQRLALLKSLRKLSQQSISAKQTEVMDVNQHAVESALRNAGGVSHLIHGHTHRPDIHHFISRGQASTRIVLGDWQEQGSYLRCDEDGYQLLTYEP